jgi:hypothetical protein
MLQTVEFKKLIKMKFGMVPALLALLSENPCTFILCLTIHAAEQQEVTEDDFKLILECILTFFFSPTLFLHHSLPCAPCIAEREPMHFYPVPHINANEQTGDSRRWLLSYVHMCPRSPLTLFLSSFFPSPFPISHSFIY